MADSEDGSAHRSFGVRFHPVLLHGCDGANSFAARDDGLRPRARAGKHAVRPVVGYCSTRTPVSRIIFAHFAVSSRTMSRRPSGVLASPRMPRLKRRSLNALSVTVFRVA